MTPGQAGRRSPWVPLALVVGFFLAGQLVFFLGPLAGLLLFSRPKTPREWFWILVATAGLLAALVAPPSLTMQTTRASVAFFTGALIIATLFGVPSLFNRAALAAVAATIATVVWFASLGLRYADVQAELLASGWTFYRTVIPNLPVRPPAADSAVLDMGPANIAGQLAQGLRSTGELYPSVLVLSAMGGAWLAWMWYIRIARTPLGAPPKPFRDFTFNDHLVWALLLVVGVRLFGNLPSLTLLTSNALIVLLAWYAARGFAVALTALQATPIVPRVVLLVIGVVMLALFPVVGVADTWLDFRRRMAPPSGVTPWSN